ncbi:hypothetical protein HY477_01970 [Candidatus Uhrbacteria bacterium]|nr:hypothetical protein [Candidatus Uhrbacteria bacterium]
MMKSKICPVCMAVSGTWLALTLGILVGVLNPEPWKLVIAMLAGGSVVGIAYQGEKAIKPAAQNPMLWKMLVLPPGFLAAYGAVQWMSFWTLGGAVIVLVATAYLFFIRRGLRGAAHGLHSGDASNVEKIEKGLERCC